jgi:hypothetical protein
MKKLLIVSLGLAAFAGCSGNASGPKKVEADGLKDRGSFCKAWAEAACNEDVVDACQAADQDSCIVAQKAHCTALVPPGYKSTRAEECITAVARAYDDTELDKTELDLVLNLGGSCSHLVEGVSGVGGSCILPTDCNTVKGYSCVFKAGNPEGTCQIPDPQGPGEPCDEPAQVCDAGSYCAGSDEDGYNCLVTKAQGKACTYDAMCDTSDLCDKSASTDDGVTGKCAPKLERSDTCTTADECASGICLEGSTKSVCADAVRLTFGSPYCMDLGGA